MVPTQTYAEERPIEIPTSSNPIIAEMIANKKKFIEKPDTVALESLNSISNKPKSIDLDKWIKKDVQNKFIEGKN